MGHEGHSCEHRDRLGRGHGLLGGDPALLHREARDVSRSEHGVGPADAAVLVDVDEALERLRNAVEPLPAESRQRDDAIHG